MAAGKLSDFKRTRGVGKMSAQERLETEEVELFTGPQAGGTVTKIGSVRRKFSPSAVSQKRSVVQVWKRVE